MKCKEEARFPHRYIESVKSPDGYLIQSSREIREAFQVHFRDRFARLPATGVLQVSCRLPSLQEAEAAACERLVTECEVHDALRQVSLNKTPELDGLL